MQLIDSYKIEAEKKICKEKADSVRTAGIKHSL